MAREHFKDLKPFHRRYVERGIYAWTTPAGKKCYGVSYRDPSGKRIRRLLNTDKLTLARKELRRVEVSVEDGTYLDNKKARPEIHTMQTVDEFRLEYVEHIKLDKTT
jgi:hypothetical protein